MIIGPLGWEPIIQFVIFTVAVSGLFWLLTAHMEDDGPMTFPDEEEDVT